MTVLVTGGAGYIGSHVVWALIDAGEKVIVLDDLSTGFEKNLPIGNPLLDFVWGDYGDQKIVGHIVRTQKVETVFHFAGSIVVSESVDKPLEYYENNAGKMIPFLEAIVAVGVRNFIFSSTAAVYGSPKLLPVMEDGTELKPLSPYGLSKLIAEQFLQSAADRYGFQYAILRYFNAAGADPKGRTGQSTKNATHLIKIACEVAVRKRKWMDIYGTDYPTPDGTCVRDYIHVSDLADAHLKVLDYLRSHRKSLIANCGYGGMGYSVKEVVDAVQRISGCEFEIRIAPKRVGDPVRIVASPERLKKLTGWKPRYNNLDLIVKHALAWERKMVRAAKPAKKKC